jgi:hypothetical protein
MKIHTVIQACLFLMVNSLLFTATASAQEQNAAWQTEFIDLTITLDPGRGIMRGDAGLQLKNLGTGNGDILLTLNHQLRVKSVQDEAGRDLPYERSENSLVVRPQGQLATTEMRTIHVRYQGAFHERLPELDLLNAWIGPKIGYAFYSSRWYPQMPEPLRRSRGKITYLVPEDWTVARNTPWNKTLYLHYCFPRRIFFRSSRIRPSA